MVIQLWKLYCTVLYSVLVWWSNYESCTVLYSVLVWWSNYESCTVLYSVRDYKKTNKKIVEFFINLFFNTITKNTWIRKYSSYTGKVWMYWWSNLIHTVRRWIIKLDEGNKNEIRWLTMYTSERPQKVVEDRMLTGI